MDHLVDCHFVAVGVVRLSLLGLVVALGTLLHARYVTVSSVALVTNIEGKCVRSVHGHTSTSFVLFSNYYFLQSGNSTSFLKSTYRVTVWAQIYAATTDALGAQTLTSLCSLLCCSRIITWPRSVGVAIYESHESFPGPMD